MAYNIEMVDRFRDALTELGVANIEERKMFGALGFMVGGKLVACVGIDDVMFKLGRERCSDLVEQGIAVPVAMGRRTMKDWVNVDFSRIQDFRFAKELVSQSIHSVANQP